MHCYATEMCGRGPVRRHQRVRKLFERPRTQPYVQLRTQTRLTEFVNCTYAMNANRDVILEFLVIVLTWRETPLMCLPLLICCTGDITSSDVALANIWAGPRIHYVLDPCDVALRASSVSIHAPLQQHNRLPQPVSF